MSKTPAPEPDRLSAAWLKDLERGSRTPTPKDPPESGPLDQIARGASAALAQMHAHAATGDGPATVRALETWLFDLWHDATTCPAAAPQTKTAREYLTWLVAGLLRLGGVPTDLTWKHNIRLRAVLGDATFAKVFRDAAHYFRRCAHPLPPDLSGLLAKIEPHQVTGRAPGIANIARDACVLASVEQAQRDGLPIQYRDHKDALTHAATAHGLSPRTVERIYYAQRDLAELRLLATFDAYQAHQALTELADARATKAVTQGETAPPTLAPTDEEHRAARLQAVKEHIARTKG